jgi:hypothetical protein
VDLAQAASYFDLTVCTDAYSPFSAFYGQMDVFDDSKRDGVTVDRRVLSVAPTVVIPARRVVTIANEQWIVGVGQADHFQGAKIRDKYVLHKSDGAVAIGTPAQHLKGGTTSSYGAHLWVKDSKEMEVSSTLRSFLNIYLSTTEAPLPGHIISLLGRYNLVRNVFLSAAGFQVAECNQLASDTLQAATYTARTGYNQATDAFTEGTPKSLNLFKARFQDDYEYASKAADKMEPGDMRVLIAAADVATPAANDKVTIAGVVWKVITPEAEGATTWNLHLRRA